MKVGKMDNLDKRTSIGNIMRKKFSDNTNSPPQPKPQVNPLISPHDYASTKEYIYHLVKELSLAREKLKALQHAFACEEALLKAKNLELKESEMILREYEFKRDSKSYNANRSSKTRCCYTNKDVRTRRYLNESHI
ncbi:putative serine/threonine-protein kinase irlF-like [Dorcoceras hygrometricum]|uniref:Putative serine/threonine-protein kinase irlF-like n=1 Tax=Dorcoceras hygrometricum TaxID=472368 RepID=A0A2Z7B5W0_9LAMI|nr:putative serine/threonine-protein kinase irlF-like [Dorcoceras hygrometricum]